jgi:imidazolonepropionase-like amidohydrolase
MIIFENAKLLDCSTQNTLLFGHVAVDEGIIVEVSDIPIKSASAIRFDLRGSTLMPGLIDAHAHVTLIESDMTKLRDMPVSLLAARAGVLMKKMLMRGFTTVRDTGGADWGLKQAVSEGSLIGPRLFISARGLSQGGGHGDHRTRTQGFSPCACSDARQMTSVVADGKPAVIAASREQQRQGADQIKIFVSGGVASQYDPLNSVQYSSEELEAVVDEARRWGIYVCAHAYSADAIMHALSAGIRTIEHGNFIDHACAEKMSRDGAYIVPTLITYEAMHRVGARTGLSAESLRKLEVVRSVGLKSIEICRQAGAKVGFGTDLLGNLEAFQSEEFLIRAEGETPFEIIKSATVINAEIIRQQDKLGVIKNGAIADLIVVDGNPLEDLNLLQHQGRHMNIIMKDGVIHKNNLGNNVN